MAKNHMTEYPLRYPWDDWFARASKRPIKLRRGEHFPCMIHSMGVQIRTAAAERGLRVKVLTADNILTVEVL